MVISVRLKPPKSCLQPQILSDDLSDFNRNWNSKPELAGVMVCCLAGRAKTERPRRATALLGAYWCKTCHNYLPLWPPLLENTNRNAVRKPSQQGHRFLGLLFISFTHSPHQLENVTAILSKTGPVFFPWIIQRKNRGLVRVSGYQKSLGSENRKASVSPLFGLNRAWIIIAIFEDWLNLLHRFIDAAELATFFSKSC